MSGSFDDEAAGCSADSDMASRGMVARRKRPRVEVDASVSAIGYPVTADNRVLTGSEGAVEVI